MDQADKISQRYDWGFLGLVALLTGIGLMTLYSSVYLSEISLFYKQLSFVALGLVIAIFMGLLDYRFLERLAWPFYFLTLFLLLMVEFFGRSAAGSQRWLSLGAINLQPSELAKLAVVLVLAKFFSHKSAPPNGYGLRDLIPVFLIVAVPMIMVFMQPDLGTAMMIGLTAASVIFLCHLKMKSLVILMISFLTAAPIVYSVVLKEYQRDRVRTFLDPQRDPLGEGYHSIQSMIAVGSGQVFGKGYLQGTQSKLEFLPKHHTDFIFSAFGEEWGFIGALVVLALFTLMVFLGVDIARKSRDKFGSVLAVGCLSLIVWHVIVNIGMEIGVLPVVGVTLPFFSYGGSNLVTNMLAVGVLLSVSYRRHIF
ncbi:MAG: rod shape-determining protein RodA [Bradymonadales bacterium]|nr:MAG: rod shape-determining protein RodA [Bradymonadales bacterium]